jgi:hypothetical protein
MKNCAFKLMIVAILAGAVAIATVAQVSTSTINGIVTDPHQAVVSGVHISATMRPPGSFAKQSRTPMPLLYPES